jgi:2-octaprenyl-6-methoxyphenol hydroxylase
MTADEHLEDPGAADAPAMRCDVLVAGAGFVGLALGIVLARIGLRVALVDPALGRAPPADPRASTVAAGPRRLLESAGVWAEVAAAEPVRAMDIGDAHLSDIMRPVLLTLAGEAAPGEPFAHVVMNADLLAALRRTAGAAERLALLPQAVTDTSPGSAATTVRLGDGRTVRAALCVAADGVRSQLRGMARIPTRGWRYDAASILTTVALEHPHGGRAVQHFLEGGPLALLPLPDQRASVIWTERRLAARRLAALPDDAFLAELQARAGDVFGKLVLAGPRGVRPLALQLAASFTAPRLALVGDAAHTVHPLAGQGLNLGLCDVAALAEAVVDAARLGQDIGSPDVLARYARLRRFDTMTMVAATDALARLFGTSLAPLRVARDTGLGLVERAPRLKSALVQGAAGLSGPPLRLLHGKPL